MTALATIEHSGSAGHVPNENMPSATVADLGRSRNDIHDASVIRDAEEVESPITTQEGLN
jgi:hypothetical protein